LLIKAGMPLGIGHSFEDAPNESLLVLGVKAAGDDGFGDAPVVGGAGAQKAVGFVEVIPGKAHGLALLLGEGLIEQFYEGLCLRGVRLFGGMKEGSSGPERSQRGGSGSAEKVAAGQGMLGTHPVSMEGNCLIAMNLSKGLDHALKE
jgi:hypothetical protein